MKPYNGHRSWNAWNVALWIGSDEPLYRFALDCINKASKDLTGKTYQQWKDETTVQYPCQSIAARATRGFLGYVVDTNERTPDGAKYNHLSVKLALLGLMDGE